MPATSPRRINKSPALWLALAWCMIFTPTAWSWSGDIHTRISRAALAVQPRALRELWSHPYSLSGDKGAPRPISDYLTAYDFWSGGPDHTRSALQDPFLYHEGPWVYHYFSSLSHEESLRRTRRAAAWAFGQMARAFREGRAADAARYAGGLAHTLEDRSCPVHAWDEYAREREALETRFADRGLQDAGKSFRGNAKSYSAVWFVDDRGVNVNLKDYRPRLLGATPAEAAAEVARRFPAIGEDTRQTCSGDPDRPGTFLHEHLKDEWHGAGYYHPSGPATVALLDKMAETSAMLVADVFTTGYRLSLSGDKSPEARNRPSPR